MELFILGIGFFFVLCFLVIHLILWWIRRDEDDLLYDESEDGWQYSPDTIIYAEDVAYIYYSPDSVKLWTKRIAYGFLIILWVAFTVTFCMGGFTQIHRSGELTFDHDYSHTFTDLSAWYGGFDKDYPITQTEDWRWPWEQKYVDTYKTDKNGITVPFYGRMVFPEGTIYLHEPIKVRANDLFLDGNGVWLKPQDDFVGNHVVEVDGNEITIQNIKVDLSDYSENAFQFKK